MKVSFKNEKKYKEQVNLLKSAIQKYDEGLEESALDMAIRCRVLLHDTNKSKSLLSMMNMKSIKFKSIQNEFIPSNLAPFTKNVSYNCSIKKDYAILTYHPAFSENYEIIFGLDFCDWWNEIIIKDNNGNIFSRKDIVLFLANKAGGAHIDEEIPESFFLLEEANSIGIFASHNGEKYLPSNSVLYAEMYIIAFELLLSLNVINKEIIQFYDDWMVSKTENRLRINTINTGAIFYYYRKRVNEWNSAIYEIAQGQEPKEKTAEFFERFWYGKFYDGSKNTIVKVEDKRTLLWTVKM